MKKPKIKQYVWAFMYNPCIHESADAVMSLHETEAGAVRAMERHQNKHGSSHSWESWHVSKMPVCE